MIEFPKRIGQLIERLEAGEEPTPEELDRIARLQALDIARVGEDFVKRWGATSDQKLEEFRQLT